MIGTTHQTTDGALDTPRWVIAWSWCMVHRKLVTVALISAALLITLINQFMHPGEAQAIPIVPIIAAVALVGGGAWAVNEAGSIEGLFRNGANFGLSVSQSVLGSLADASLLRRTFEDLIPGVYDVISPLHHSVFVPAGIVVLLVFFVIGLCSVFKTAGQHDAGIDLWQIFLCYIMLAVGMLLINNSLEIMVLIYSVCLNFMTDVLQSGVSNAALSIQGIPDEVTDWGVLFICCIVSLISMLVSFVVYLISVGTIVVRSIQIYVYSALSPIPLAFMVSESSRPMATGFLKRYFAVVLSGIVLALLFVMYASILGMGAGVETIIDSQDNAVRYVMEIFMALLMPLAFGFCIAKSGAWAKEIVGVG